MDESLVKKNLEIPIKKSIIKESGENDEVSLTELSNAANSMAQLKENINYLLNFDGKPM